MYFLQKDTENSMYGGRNHRESRKENSEKELINRIKKRQLKCIEHNEEELIR